MVLPDVLGFFRLRRRAADEGDLPSLAARVEAFSDVTGTGREAWPLTGTRRSAGLRAENLWLVQLALMGRDMGQVPATTVPPSPLSVCVLTPQRTWPGGSLVFGGAALAHIQGTASWLISR